MTKRLTIDTFTTETYDGNPFELLVMVGQDTATVYIPGMIKARLGATMPKAEAFALYHNACVMTWHEVRKQIDPYLL